MRWAIYRASFDRAESWRERLLNLRLLSRDRVRRACLTADEVLLAELLAFIADSQPLR